MTDEEMAEEYADEKCKDCYMCSYSEHKNPYKICQRRKDVKQAYLAGLKAGRPQWHKVADGDLPKIDKPCLVYLANDYVIIAKLREDNVWTTNGHNAFENVIAWKEIVLPELLKENE
jgi:hypothetical protein